MSNPNIDPFGLLTMVESELNKLKSDAVERLRTRLEKSYPAELMETLDISADVKLVDGEYAISVSVKQCTS